MCLIGPELRAAMKSQHPHQWSNFACFGMACRPRLRAVSEARLFHCCVRLLRQQVLRGLSRTMVQSTTSCAQCHWRRKGSLQGSVMHWAAVAIGAARERRTANRDLPLSFLGRPILFYYAFLQRLLRSPLCCCPSWCFVRLFSLPLRRSKLPPCCLSAILSLFGCVFALAARLQVCSRRLSH